MSLSEPPEEHLRLVELEGAVLADVDAYGRCPLADKPRVAKLSAAIQDRLGRIRALTRDLELAAEEAEGEEEEQRALAALLAQHKAAYARIQAAFKQAAVDQRTAALRSAAEERRELLAGGEAGLRQRRAQTEADAAALAEDVTGGLRRTRQVLAEELEHTSATLAAMEASHAQLGKTRDEYHGQHRHLKKSKGLLGTLNWQAKSETYMLWFGLTLFLAVCAYIFQKRAGHFVPNALKPTTLLAGRQPVPAPGTLRRPPAVPLHKAGGAHRQPQMPRHQHRRPPAGPIAATQQPGEPQAGGGDAVWPSGAPELEQQQQQQQQAPQQQAPQQPGQTATLPPPPPLDQPPQQPEQQQQPEQPVQQQQQQQQQPEQPVQQQQQQQQQQPELPQQPELLEPVPAEPEAQPREGAGAEAQPALSAGGSQQPPEAGEQLQAPEQQAAGEQQADSGSAADAEAQPAAGQQGAGEAELAAATGAAAAAMNAEAAAAVEQAAAEAAAAAAHEAAAVDGAVAAQVEAQAAGGEPPAVGPEGAPEPDRHVILDRQGRRIAVDPTAEFARSPLGGQPAGEPAGEEAPRDEL